MLVSNLEPCGIFTLAGGLLYSIGVLIIQTDESNYKFHFIILIIVIFVALISITLFKYLKYRYRCEEMDDLIASLKIE